MNNLIICPVHGEFSQLLINHLSGAGCKKCNLNKGEILIEKSLRELQIDNYVCEKTFEGLVNPVTGKKLRYDFYLPNHNLLIEYDGKQHFHPAYFIKSQTKQQALEDLGEVKRRDALKSNFAKKNNIKLLRISYLQQKDDITKLIKDML